MAETNPNATNPPTPPASTATPAAAAAAAQQSERTPKAGSKVNVVLANGGAVPAEISKVRKDGLVDLFFDYRGEEVVITSSPFDPEGKKSDSWHWPSAAE